MVGMKRVNKFFIRIRNRVQRLRRQVNKMVEKKIITLNRLKKKAKAETEEERQGTENSVPTVLPEEPGFTDKNPHGTNLKTPVLRGVIVSEFDGEKNLGRSKRKYEGTLRSRSSNNYSPEDFAPWNRSCA